MNTLVNRILRRITGREYSIETTDLIYIIEKGLTPLIRGFIWQCLKFQKPNGFMLGKNVRILGARFLALGKGISIGSNSYIDCYSHEGIVLKNGVTIREGAWIQCRSGLNSKGQGLEIHNNTYIGPNAVIGVGGKVIIHSNVQAGAALTISAESHELGDSSYVEGGTHRRGVVIEKNVWIGNNVTVLDGIHVGENSVIGAGSVVTKNIPPRSIAAGVPAKVIKQL
ncbi:acyltransferase [Ketobacter sp.]|uniref:acyltransferase n=1 Tax=Ketobacter sp. TaxID=2083498 RepID=UPI000F15BA21|nr:acyltransferase [Ketobacter sp.]RLT92290.1 MAG: acyltransferase [Ketobacter sp.]